MKTSRLLKILAILAVTALVTGCKISVMVPSGGEVKSESGTHSCAEGNVCTINITDSTFYEVFTAVARPGYVFSKWSAGGPAFFCGDSTNPNCEITNLGTEGDANIQAIIASGKQYYVMPIFKFVGIDTDGDGQKDHVDADDDNDGVLDGSDLCPRNPDLECVLASIIVDGREWAQPDLFGGLTSAGISAVCDSGDTGVCNGVLNGFDMTGWTWASLADVLELYASYVAANGADRDVPGWDECATRNAMLNDGWRPWGPSSVGGSGFLGYVRAYDRSNGGQRPPWVYFGQSYKDVRYCYQAHLLDLHWDVGLDPRAFFYRD
jgi:hypothetical protein